MNTPEFSFDFSRMTVGDVVFIAMLDKSQPPDPVQINRYFQLLGRVGVNLDAVPIAQLPQIINAMGLALVEHINLSAVYGSFVDTLDMPSDEPMPPELRAGYAACGRCGERYSIAGTICTACGYDYASQDERVGWNKCEACGKRWGGIRTTCPHCKHEHFNGAEQDND